jgi:hypothetical protein
MSSHNKTSVALREVVAENPPPDDSDWVWGGENLAKEINRTTQQFYYLYEKGVLKGTVAKLGHKTFVGSRRKLRAILLG